MPGQHVAEAPVGNGPFANHPYNTEYGASVRPASYGRSQIIESRFGAVYDVPDEVVGLRRGRVIWSLSAM
jgi:hypothetical protein